MENEFEVIVVGGGPAALTASLYLGRYERRTLILASEFGGQTAISGMIENFPGIAEIDGFSLIENLRKQVSDQRTVIMKSPATVKKVTKGDRGFEILTERGDWFFGKSVVIAAGKRHRKLGLKDEDSLIGKGLSYCATCDGPFSKDKDVVIAGGGYAATEAALILAKTASNITMINIVEGITGERVTLDKIGQEKKIRLIDNTEITEFLLENGFISGVKSRGVDTKKEEIIKAEMVFVEVGQMPNSENFRDLVKLNDAGEIEIDKNNMSSQPGVFASGDITDVPAKQTIVAAGEGARAAIALNKYLESLS